MNVFSLLTVFLMLSLGTPEMNKEAREMIDLETNYYCQCNNKLDKEIRIINRKSKKQEKENRNKKYKLGDRLFGGSTLDFSYKDCLEQRRSNKVKDYLKKMSPEEKDKFNKNVQIKVNKKCPQKSDFY